MLKKIFNWLIGLSLFAFSSSIVIWYLYSQRFVQDSPNTATKGIIFNTTLNLDAYKNIASGNGWLGKFDRYSRSDRHTEVITVYCKDYCKKK